MENNEINPCSEIQISEWENDTLTAYEAGQRTAKAIKKRFSEPDEPECKRHDYIGVGSKFCEEHQKLQGECGCKEMPPCTCSPLEINAKPLEFSINPDKNKYRPDGPIVVCAALKSTTGKIVCGARHYDPIMRQQIAGSDGKRSPEWISCEQGFIDQRGNFLTREEAWKIAEKNGQIKYNGGWNGTLYSEDLY
jgi:hypothetical protein